ncbi:MAG: hypothetical protein AAGA75_15615 [Cyanobacteria bacterium P01_E01_bin.6]
MFLAHTSTEKLVYRLHAQEIRIRNLLLSIAIALVLCALGGIYRPAQADTDLVVIDIPTQGQVPHSNLMTQAEQLVAREIVHQFTQNTEIDTLQVSVLGHRNGEVIPLMTTVVSREQWQQIPQVSAWSRYHNAYALLQRHDQERVVAISPARPSGSVSSFSQDTSFVDEALDAGQVSSEIARDYLSDLD